MRVLVAGATGFIGRALIALLRREGHAVVALVRDEGRARGRLGASVELVPIAAGADVLALAMEQCDAVVNLAGEPLMGGRWTAVRRAILEESRLGTTAQLVGAIAAARSRPAVLVSGSAVGYYGDRGDEPLTEASSAGDDFLARLCQEWEDAAQRAELLGVRVVRLRTGVVLGRGGGALARMLPPFTFGVGGPIGSGKQYLPWIHLHDLVRVITAAIGDERYQGPVNGVAPEQVTSRTFARTLGRALHRPAVLPLPAFVLKTIFGEAAIVLLASQRVKASALEQCRFAYAFPTLTAALENVVGADLPSGRP